MTINHLSSFLSNLKHSSKEPALSEVKHHETYNYMAEREQELSTYPTQCRVSYQALYSYTPQNDDELELRDGDIVDVMEKCDDGWFVGTSRRTRQFGTFPGNYVKLLYL
ncbi:hypothetical protein EK904_005882 [Melospiza melodia maxima]|nr:hypothetical protein EK904_005882 [Melospiza melodia maxima]